MVAKMNVVYG